MRKVTMKGKLTVGQKRQHVEARLRRGDMTRISSNTGYEISYVSRVLRGERNNEDIVNEAYRTIGKRKTVNS